MGHALRHARVAPTVASVCVAILLAASLVVSSDRTPPDDVIVPTVTEVPNGPRGGAGPAHDPEPEPLQSVSGHSLIGAFWEQNAGQWPDDALWVLRGGPTVALTHDGLLIPTQGGDPVRLLYLDGDPMDPVVVEGRTSTTSIIGGGVDAVGIAHAERLRVPQVWGGIDLELYVTEDGGFEFDFVVAPGADPDDARFVVSGAAPHVDEGHLVLGDHRFQPPRSFQEDQVIDSRFDVQGDVVGIEVGPYDPRLSLVIDPKLTYGTLVAPPTGHIEARVYASVENKKGLYFGGTLFEPHDKTWHPQLTQAFDQGMYGHNVGFFVHLDPRTHALLAFVELRNEYDHFQFGTFAYDLDVDAQGRVYLVGKAGFYDWDNPAGVPAGIPTVGGKPHSGGLFYDGYLARFAPVGGSPLAYQLQYSTHIGSTYQFSYYDTVSGVVVNPDGTFWVGGTVHGQTVFPSGGTKTVHPATAFSGTYTNVFGILFSDAAQPAPLSTGIVGTGYYDFGRRFATDSEGDLYFTGKSFYVSWTQLDTTSDALQPTLLSKGSEHQNPFYGKMLGDGSVAHLSYWGSKNSERGTPHYANGEEPALAVLGVDEIVVAGTVRGCCLEHVTPQRLTPSSYGGSDGYVSHIRLGGDLVFSSHVGSKEADFVHAVAFDPLTETYFVGGTARAPVQPDVAFTETMPRATHNGRYDAFVTAIQPARADPSQPMDEQEAMVAYTMYVGNAAGSFASSSNVVYDLSISPARNLLVGGNQGGSWSLADAAPTTSKAIDNGLAGDLSNAAMFQKYRLMNGLDLHATDGVRSADSPDALFETLTLTNVQLTASIDPEYLQGVAAEQLSWDLDGDGVYSDGSGFGPHVVRRDQAQSVQVCVQAPHPLPSAPPVTTCMEILFANRPPAVTLELMDEPVGMLDPLPYFHVGQAVWYDAGFTHDPEGALDFDRIEWRVEAIDQASGEWAPDPSADMGGHASLGVSVHYGEPGAKRVTLFVQDIEGAMAQASLMVVIVPEPPALGCTLAGAVRMDRWIDLDVLATPAEAPLQNWTLDPGMGLTPMAGSGAPPSRIRTAEVLPTTGDGTLVLTVHDEAGAQASCVLDYTAGPRTVTADFFAGDAVAGRPVTFTDRSFPETPQHPILAWRWQVDGLDMATDRNTTHIFGHSGVYMVSLSVTDGQHTDTYSSPIAVSASTAPMARIGAASPPYLAGEKIRLSDQSLAGSAPIVAWEWDIGGHEDRRRDPSVMLPAGEHAVHLKVYDLNGLVGEDATTLRVVDPGRVVPEFTVSDLEPTVGEAVRFTDVSRAGADFIELREWSFADGGRVAHGTTADHIFWQPGIYDVTLTLYDSDGNRHAVVHLVTVSPPAADDGRDPASRLGTVPIADAGVDRRVAVGSVLVLDPDASLSRQSQGVTASWRQVGGPSVELVPQGRDVSLRVPYAPGEVIALELVVSDQNGVSAPDTVRLHIVSEHADGLGEVAMPDGDFAVERTGRIIRLTAPPHAVAAAYVWDMGDGTELEGRSVVHEYVAHGLYDVTLTVRDVHGQETLHREVVEVRSSDDAAPGSSVASKKAVLGIGLERLLLAGLVFSAACVLAATLVRRSRF